MRNKYIVGFNNVMMNTHWTLFFADIEQKLIYYLDPMTSTDLEKQMVLRKWINFITNVTNSI